MKPSAVIVAAVLTASAVVSGAAHGETRETTRNRAVPAPQPDAKSAASRPDAREHDKLDKEVDTRPPVRVILASPFTERK